MLRTDIDIFQKCRYIDNRYVISIYRTGLAFMHFFKRISYIMKIMHFHFSVFTYPSLCIFLHINIIAATRWQLHISIQITTVKVERYLWTEVLLAYRFWERQCIVGIVDCVSVRCKRLMHFLQVFFYHFIDIKAFLFIYRFQAIREGSLSGLW